MKGYIVVLNDDKELVQNVYTTDGHGAPIHDLKGWEIYQTAEMAQTIADEAFNQDGDSANHYAVREVEISFV